MMSKFILAAMLLASVLLSAHASNPIRGMFGKGARKLMEGGPPGNINANYGWGSDKLMYQYHTVIDSTGVHRTVTPLVQSSSAAKAKTGRKLQQGGPLGNINIDYGWSTNNLLYTWQYRLDSTGSHETVAPMVKKSSSSSSSSAAKAKGGRKLQQGGPLGSIDIDRHFSTNDLLYTWQYRLDSTGSHETVAPMVPKSTSATAKAKSGR